MPVPTLWDRRKGKKAVIPTEWGDANTAGMGLIGMSAETDFT